MTTVATPKLLPQGRILADQLAIKIDMEDDSGKIQQVSGGFGDSNQMDSQIASLLA